MTRYSSLSAVSTGGGLAGLLVLDALVDEQGGVAAVVEDHVRAAGGGVRPGQRLLGAPPVLLQGLALPGEDRDALRVLRGAVRADGDGGGGVVLGGEDVAGGPADLGAEGDQGLDEDGGLHGHVQRAGDAGAGQRLGGGVLLADGHQAGHLVLGEGDLLAAELGQGEVGDLEVLSVVDSRHASCSSWVGSRVGTAGLLRRRAQACRRHTACPRARSAVRRRPSLPRPVRVRDRPTAISSDVWLGHESTPIGPAAPVRAAERAIRPIRGRGAVRERPCARRRPGQCGGVRRGAGPPGVASGSVPLAASASL